MLHRGIVRPSEVFAVQNYRTGVPVASNKAARYRTLAYSTDEVQGYYWECSLLGVVPDVVPDVVRE